MFLGGSGNRLEGGAPAALAHLVGIHEVVGRFAALLAIERHGPCHAAHAQSARESLRLNPFDEFHGHVPIVIRMRFFRCEEKGPRTKQQRHAYDSQDHYERQKHLRAPLLKPLR